NRSLASEWNNLLDKMLDSGVEVQNADSIESLQKNSEGLQRSLEETFLLRKELNNTLVNLQERLTEERNRLYDLQIANAKTVLGILTRSGAATVAMIDTWARGTNGSVRFGDENASRVV